MRTPSHAPVLLDRVVALLTPALEEPGSVYVDCTLGLGGHSEAVLERLPQARVIGIDRDPAALEMSRERLAAHGERFTAVHAVYDELPEVLGSLGIDHADAVFFDLGVSSMQLDVRDRGFAYSEDAPLDMRMDPTTGQTAADLLNTATAAGADPHPARVRRGEVRQQDRPRGRTPSRDHAVHHERRAGRAALRHHPGAGPAYGRPPRQAHVPGAADGGQRRARRPAPRDPRRDRVDRGRRPRGRGVLPLARGPAGQAGLRRRHPPRRAARPAVRARGRRARPAPGHPRRRAGRRARDRREPPGRLRPAARRRARPAARTTSRPDSRKTSRPASRPLPPGVVR